MLATTIAYLFANKKVAKGFLAKNAKFRKFWMDDFFFTQL